MEPTVQTVPVTPNQVGGFVGQATPADPAQQVIQRAMAAEKAQADLGAFNAAHPGLAGGPAAAPPVIKIPDDQIEPITSGAEPLAVPPAATPAVDPNAHAQIAPNHPVMARALAHAATQAPPNPDGLMAPNLPPETPTQAIHDAEANKASLGEDAVKIAEQKAVDDQKIADARLAEHEAQVAEIERVQAQQKEAIRVAQEARDTARAEVKDFKFHDFYEGHTGKRFLAALAMGLGGRDASAVIEKKIANHFDQQKEALKLKQDFALAKSGDVEELRAIHREELAGLKFKQAAALESLAAKADQMAAQTKGKGDVNNAKQLAASLRATAAQIDIKTQHDIAQTELLRAQAAHARAQAAEVRAKAGIGGGKAAAKAEQEVAKQLDKLETRTDRETKGLGGKGVVSQLRTIQATKADLTNALASGDPNQIRAATDAVKEAIGPILSGGRTTQFLGKTISDSKSLEDALTELKGKLTSNPSAGKTYAKQMIKLIEQGESAAIEKVKGAREDFVQRTLGPGGMASTPAGKARAINMHDAFFAGAVDAQGRPLFGKNDQAAPVQASAAPPPAVIEQARKAANDPNAPPAIKAKAQAILHAAGM